MMERVYVCKDILYKDVFCDDLNLCSQNTDSTCGISQKNIGVTMVQQLNTSCTFSYTHMDERSKYFYNPEL